MPPVGNIQPLPKQMSAGYSFTAFIKQNKVFTCGLNRDGQLGDDSYTNRIKPGEVKLANNVVDLASGYAYGIALDSDGVVWGWGDNHVGQLGSHSRDNKPVPIQIESLPPIASVFAAGDRVAALTNSGEVWAWGSLQGLDSGEMISGVDSADVVWGESFYPFMIRPYKVPLPEIMAISAGFSHTLALDVEGRVWAWGFNISKELGINSTKDSPDPLLVNGIDGIIAIAAGEFFSMALRECFINNRLIEL